MPALERRRSLHPTNEPPSGASRLLRALPWRPGDTRAGGAEPATRGSSWPPLGREGRAGFLSRGQLRRPLQSCLSGEPLPKAAGQTERERAGSLPGALGGGGRDTAGAVPGPAPRLRTRVGNLRFVPGADNTSPLWWERRGGKVALQEPFERA